MRVWHGVVVQRLLLTLLSLTGPPNEAMPFSTFLMMAGCSTTEMARDGIGSHDACWLSPFAVGVDCSSLMAHCNRFFCSQGTEYNYTQSRVVVFCRVCPSTAEGLSNRAHTQTLSMRGPVCSVPLKYYLLYMVPGICLMARYGRGWSGDVQPCNAAKAYLSSMCVVSFAAPGSHLSKRPSPHGRVYVHVLSGV